MFPQPLRSLPNIHEFFYKILKAKERKITYLLTIAYRNIAHMIIESTTQTSSVFLGSYRSGAFSMHNLMGHYLKDILYKVLLD